MSEVALTARQRRRSLSAVIASMTVQALIFGLSMPLLALVLEARGIDKVTIGLSAGAQAVAVFAVAPFAARLISILGLPRLMIGSTLLSVAMFLLLLTESGQEFEALLFEATSAMGTVGLSTGITADLSDLGKLIVIVLMTAGRVGILTFGIALAAHDESRAEEQDDNLVL